MKVLMISKALVTGSYHSKIQEMVKQGIDITLVIPEKWGKQKPEIINSSSYKIVANKAIFHGKNHFHYYSGLLNKLNIKDYDLIHIDEEHYSLVTYQILKYANKNDICAIFFTWQNINKKYPPPFSWTENYVLKNAAGAIAGNQEAADILKKKELKAMLL